MTIDVLQTPTLPNQVETEMENLLVDFRVSLGAQVQPPNLKQDQFSFERWSKKCNERATYKVKDIN